MRDPEGTPYTRALNEVLTRHPLGSQGLATLVNTKGGHRDLQKMYGSNYIKSRMATKPPSQKGSQKKPLQK